MGDQKDISDRSNTASSTKRMGNYALLIIAKIESWAMGIGLVFITSIMCLEVAVRYIFEESVRGFEELAIFAMMATIFIGAAYSTRTKTHIRIDVLHLFIKDELMAKKIRWGLNLLNCLLSMVFLFWICQVLFRGAYIVSPELRIPLRVPQAVIACGALLMIFYFLLFVIKDFPTIRRKR